MPKPKEIFVDTSTWTALAVSDDAHHQAAARVYPELIKRHRLVTINLVVAESYVLLRRKAGLYPAVSFLEMLETSPRIRKVYSTPKLEEEAYQILKRYRDQDFSLTDAASFVLMKGEEIEQTFAVDRHFQTMDFPRVAQSQ